MYTHMATATGTVASAVGAIRGLERSSSIDEKIITARHRDIGLDVHLSPTICSPLFAAVTHT